MSQSHNTFQTISLITEGRGIMVERGCDDPTRRGEARGRGTSQLGKVGKGSQLPCVIDSNPVRYSQGK